jgi:hypothetical protein
VVRSTERMALAGGCFGTLSGCPVERLPRRDTAQRGAVSNI